MSSLTGLNRASPRPASNNSAARLRAPKSKPLLQISTDRDPAQRIEKSKDNPQRTPKYTPVHRESTMNSSKSPQGKKLIFSAKRKGANPESTGGIPQVNLNRLQELILNISSNHRASTTTTLPSTTGLPGQPSIKSARRETKFGSPNISHTGTGLHEKRAEDRDESHLARIESEIKSVLQHIEVRRKQYDDRQRILDALIKKL